MNAVRGSLGSALGYDGVNKPLIVCKGKGSETMTQEKGKQQ